MTGTESTTLMGATSGFKVLAYFFSRGWVVKLFIAESSTDMPCGWYAYCRRGPELLDISIFINIG